MIDEIAEMLELQRHENLGVISPRSANDPFIQTARLLRTKHVNTWHVKPSPDALLRTAT